MKVISQLSDELQSHLNIFKDWVFSERIQSAIENGVEWPESKFFSEGRPEYSCSKEYLQSMDADLHDGYPPDLYGIDFNYEPLKKRTFKEERGLLEEIRRINYEVDDRLANYLGARTPSLKAYYPPKGYIAWHTNWNAPGYNIIFTHSATGDGYWQHVDPVGAKSHRPDLEKIVHIPDQPGWHCKVGYFGSRQENEKLVWHSAYTNEPRLTLAYIIYDKAIWESMVEEIEDC